MSEAKFHHNSSLKQANRPFKKSKKAPKTKTVGGAAVRVPLKQQHLRDSSMKTDRVNQRKQLQKARRAELVTTKRLWTEKAAPKIIGVVALSPLVDLDALRNAISTHPQVEDCGVADKHPHILSVTVKLERAQKFIFYFAPRDSLAICDIALVSDVVLLVMTPNLEGEAIGEDPLGYAFCKVLKAAGLPSIIGLYQGVDALAPKKRGAAKKLMSRYFETAFEEPHKVLPCESETEITTLLRWTSNVHIKPPSHRDEHSYVLGESATFTPDPGDPSKGVLRVVGYLRGERALSANQLIHITGYDDFQQVRIDTMGSEGTTTADTADEKRASLQSFQEVNTLILEQSVITDEEIQRSQAANVKEPTTGAVLDYQKVWDEISDEDEGDEKLDMLDDDADMTGERSSARPSESGLSALGSTLSVKTKLDREDAEFPDEVDTPEEGFAKVRFQRYRGLKNFNHSEWDAKESLPVCYSQIYQLEDFESIRKLVTSVAQNEGRVAPNSADRIVLSLLVSETSARSICSSTRPICCWGLFEHEHKVSVLHSTVKRNNDFEAVVKSKTEVLFQIGFRRSMVTPVFSNPSVARGKAMVERRLPTGRFAVASFFGRIHFGSAPSLMFLKEEGRPEELVAWGSYLGADPDRVLVKRIVLTGYPVGVHKRSAVVKRMFYNADDIRWFKPVELWTKYGLVGHIKEPRGTKGYLKANFDGFIKNHDTVCMSLYKRQFPPWDPAKFS
jgi:pre-rRNA-processing protein TSR1